jgi:hypothetical protein
MPVLDISTNLTKSDIPADFLKKASKKVAELLSKPESVMNLIILNIFN